MNTNAGMVVCLLALGLPVGVAGQTATVTTTAGSVIQGEVQGVIVANTVRVSGEVEYAVFKGHDIRSIDQSGIVATSVARDTFRRVARSEPGGDLPLPADSVSAWIIQLTRAVK